MACVRSGTLVILLLLCPAAGFAQQAQVSFRVSPIGVRSRSPLFTVRIVDSPSRAAKIPALTLTQTPEGSQLTNVAFALPQVTFGSTPIASRIGDQRLPAAFLSSPLSGAAVQAPLRGVSFSTVGKERWTLSIGRLESSPDAATPPRGMPSVVALSLRQSPYQGVHVAPRLLVPVGSGDTGQTSIGTGMRADVHSNVALISDVAAVDTPRAGWAPMTFVGVVGEWAGATIETNVLRGAPSLDADAAITVSSQDRETAQASIRPLSGLTVSGLASRLRPAHVTHAVNTNMGSVGIAYDGLPIGRMATTVQRELWSSHKVDATSVEWQQLGTNGFSVRYTEKRSTDADVPDDDAASHRVDVELPRLAPPDVSGRLDLRAGLTADTASPAPIRSTLKGRIDIFDDHLALGGESELQLVPGNDQGILQALRLTTAIPVLQDTVLHLFYTYRAGTPSSLDKVFEARVTRTINLLSW